ncbi:uncharacterized protein LOC133709131 [Rosa rugosa]|uniref:uncharacterized protein LOC133709131 n=1 Tax=Rosa rugosa TaxID=74645 RepID=UPI002B4130C5|nr:uncharacterized protein LOC133709131 [Rosa rugosa]
MEIESNMIIKNDNLEAFDIFKKAFTISATNIKFLIFTILTSLPLFCFLVYYEPFLQRFLLEISEILKPSKDDYFGYLSSRRFQFSIPSLPTDMATKLNNEFPGGLVQIALLYLIPLHLLELSTVLVIVDLASKTYTTQEEEEPPLTLMEMVHKPFDVTRVLGTLVTFVYVVIMSSSSLLGLVWLAVIYYVVTMFFYDVLVIMWCWVGFLGLLTLYLGWIAVLNMSVVISILEGRYGTKAIALAICYSVGNEWRGFRLMLVFFAWEVGLRLPCIYFGCKGTWSVGILTQIGFFCLGNVVKWVVFTIYFYDCKNREIERKLMMKAKKRAVESG